MLDIKDIDFYTRTELCDIMRNEKSDKGNTPVPHNYTTLYDHIFNGLRNKEIKLFEMGLGTNNPNLPSNMGVNGRPGASIFGWKKYFKNSRIYGADIDRDILFEDTYYCDQRNPHDIKKVFEHIGKVDIIIDDGLHDHRANFTLLNNSIQYLNKNGFYIVEDIQMLSTNWWKGQIGNIKNKYNLQEIQLITLPHSKKDWVYNDNNILYIKK